MPFLNPFPNRFLSAADSLGRKLIRPSFFFADSLACCFIVPIPDPVHPILRCFQRLLLTPLLFSAFIICLPSAILGFSIWLLTSFTRVDKLRMMTIHSGHQLPRCVYLDLKPHKLLCPFFQSFPGLLSCHPLIVGFAAHPSVFLPGRMRRPTSAPSSSSE